MMSYEPVGKDKTISNFKCRITRSLGILQIALGLLAFSVNTVLVVRNFASNKSSKDDFPLCSLSGFWTGFFFSVTGVTALLVDTRCRVKALAVMAPFTLLVSVYLIVWSSLGIKVSTLSSLKRTKNIYIYILFHLTAWKIRAIARDSCGYWCCGCTRDHPDDMQLYEVFTCKQGGPIASFEWRHSDQG